jgi:hypothetical protein
MRALQVYDETENIISMLRYFFYLVLPLQPAFHLVDINHKPFIDQVRIFSLGILTEQTRGKGRYL